MRHTWWALASLACLCSCVPEAPPGSVPYVRPWATVGGCAELVRRFDFSRGNSSEQGYGDAFARYHACVERRAKLPDWRSPTRPSLLSGEHYPVLVAPSPVEKLPRFWVLPAWDYVVSNFIRKRGTYDPIELELYRSVSQPGDVICDVGAHVGAYTIPLASRVGAEGAIHAFEPFRLVFQLLMANVAINGLSNVYGHQVALGDAAETLRVASPSLMKPNNVGATRVFDQAPSHFIPGHVLQYGHDEDVQVVTLDSLELRRVSLIKIDVEGALVRVLWGARATILHHRPLLAVEHAEKLAPPLLLEWGYRCEYVLPLHELWVCVPEERWASYTWLEDVAQVYQTGEVRLPRDLGLRAGSYADAAQPRRRPEGTRDDPALRSEVLQGAAAGGRA